MVNVENTYAALHTVNGITGLVVYATDFQASLDFYTRLLGLTIYSQTSEHSCFLHVGDDPNDLLFLVGGFKKQPIDKDTARLSFMLRVPSAMALHARLESEAASSSRKVLLYDGLIQLGEIAYWFQVCDPSGNIVEITGGR